MPQTGTFLDCMTRFIEGSDCSATNAQAIEAAVAKGGWHYGYVERQ